MEAFVETLLNTNTGLIIFGVFIFIAIIIEIVTHNNNHPQI